tara:strand:+ start:21675 stop:21917 length:243 start_codon:yes stop_codon:yes gene_type:complete
MKLKKKAMHKILIFLISFYQKFISPLIGPNCRFQPTCSEFSKEAIQKHGPLKGVRLAAGRILKCHPLGSSGYDPVPPEKE